MVDLSVEQLETFRKIQQRTVEVGDNYFETPNGLLLPPSMELEPRPTGIDLFCGAGGFSCGFHQAGWHCVAAVEWSFDASLTYLANMGGLKTKLHFITEADHQRWDKELWKYNKRGHRWEPGTGWVSKLKWPDNMFVCEHFYFGDIRQLHGEQILEDLGMEQGQVGCVMGGPPCQGFTYAGKRNVADPRNTLVFDFCRMAVEIQPKTIIMENVPGILTMKTVEGIPVVDACARILEDGGMGTFGAMKAWMEGKNRTEETKVMLSRGPNRPKPKKKLKPKKSKSKQALLL